MLERMKRSWLDDEELSEGTDSGPRLSDGAKVVALAGLACVLPDALARLVAGDAGGGIGQLVAGLVGALVIWAVLGAAAFGLGTRVFHSRSRLPAVMGGLGLAMQPL